MSAADIQAKAFTDNDVAREAIEALMWPNGPVCAHCGCTGKIGKVEGKSARPGLYYCGDCKKQFTVTVGTILERSKVPLSKWWFAIHLLAAGKKGMSAHQLHRMIGVTYQTAWFMEHRIREAMRDGSLSPMGGEGATVEVDETFIGKRDGYEAKPGWVRHKNTVLTLAERGGSVRSFHIDEATKENIVPIVNANLDRESHLMTDEARRYEIGKDFASHGVVHHSRKGIRLHGPQDWHEGQHEHRRGLLLNFQARNEGRLSALWRKAHAPLSGRVRFPLLKPLQAWRE
jgi:transposase-like protein